MSRPKGKSSNSKKKNSKSTSVKISNKNYNKQVKRGKIRPKNNRSFQQQKKIRQSVDQAKVEENRQARLQYQNEISEESDVDVTDMLEKDDLNSLKPISLKRGLGSSFLDEEEGVEGYEKKPRRSNYPDENIRHLLPLKNKEGFIQQSIVVEKISKIKTDINNFVSQPEEFTDNQISLFQDETQNKEANSFVDLYVQRKTKLAQIKEKIGRLCSTIIEDPEENLSKFKDLLEYLDEKDPAVYLSARKMAALSLVEVFKDVLPSYQIRQLTDKETGHKMKKETKVLQEYEQSLLRYYKKFLQSIEKWLENLKKQKKKFGLSNSLTESKIKVKRNVALLALKCFSELLLAHPKFNMANNIIKIISEHSLHKIPEVSSICCETLSKLFKNDRIGDVSFEAMKHIRRIAKMRNYNITHDLLMTFLCLNVKEAVTDKSKKKDIKKIREQLSKMSRKERQHNKKMQHLEKELLETSAQESKQKKCQFQTDILEHVFLIYFQLLKNSDNTILLTPVLEGLSKFAHLINIDFFDDLINVLYKLINSGKLGDHEILYCLKTVFTILSGQGEALNIDPQGFYMFLYSSLLKIDYFTSDEDASTLLDCTDSMLTQRRKKITLQRILAFAKRISVISLQTKPNLSLALLSLVRQLLLLNQKTDTLLDPENGGSGVYMPELEDPEHCNANATCLWELHLLRKSFHPALQKYSLNILMGCPHQGNGQIPAFLALKTSKELFIDFEDSKNLLQSKKKSTEL